MSKDHPMPHFEVADPAAAMRNFESLARQALAVPKKDVDRKMAKEKNQKGRKRS